MRSRGSLAPLVETSILPPEWVWFWTIVVVLIWALIVRKSAKDEGALSSVGTAVLLVVPALLVILFIWRPDIYRWFSSIVLSLVMLGLVLALWKIPRSAPWRGWLAGAVIFVIVLVLSTFSLGPVELTDWLWIVLPLGLPTAVACLIGWPVRRHRGAIERKKERAAQEAYVALRAKRNEVGALLRAKLTLTLAEVNNDGGKRPDGGKLRLLHAIEKKVDGVR
jgi:peptidoglycan/LPS O-acetylase OafA/YrhL